ncbi:LacI family DNA-binding transcriptional regulator [Agrococcus casei]|uniref:LacI-family transcriptional regulator n=4 Tax=Agrococcus TaxID=46352 RepID=A0A1R4G5Y9_9MICO|nr:LacI family DNA-binding transcriptional regulator [Agrococcus casei]SJM63594.1 LacI-family transcriptional regulator [Agrococcus casei LMG 22410]
MADPISAPGGRATLAKVAERAGVSLKTASRALSGEAYVTDETRSKVLQAASDLDYQRNSAASLLASGRLADSIGLVSGGFTNPFYSALAQAVEDGVRNQGMHLSVANSDESPEKERLVTHDLADRQTKALIVVSSMTDHAEYRQLQARGVPVLFVDRPAVNLEADSVVFDNQEGGRLAAAHLLAAQHRRIAFVGDYAWLPTYRSRIEGMASVLDESSAEWQSLVRPDAHSITDARARVGELLAMREPPTALVAGNNRILLGILEELSPVPVADRPAIVAFDDVEWARVLGITVVAGETDVMGRRAAELTVARLADRTRQTEQVVLPMRLTNRASA